MEASQRRIFVPTLFDQCSYYQRTLAVTVASCQALEAFHTLDARRHFMDDDDDDDDDDIVFCLHTSSSASCAIFDNLDFSLGLA